MFTYPIEILIFTTSAQVGRVTNVLLSEGVQIDKPVCYEPLDYPQAPRLVYSRSALPEVHGAGDFRQGPSIFTGGYGGHVLQTKEQTEEERKKQVDSVYDSLRSGDDLPEVEPHAVIITKLFPHQKQALSFLLDREQDRSFDVPPAGEAQEAGSENGDAKGKGRAPQEEETVSLWKAVRKRDGTPRAYLNVVTNSESLRRPEVCRGAILADDMGLGKTITTIALIAHTYLDARKFGKTKPTPADPASAADSKAKENEHEEAFTGNVPGAPLGRMIKKSQGGGKVQAKRDEAERVRRKNLRTRSRATLIVLPLTLVSSWVSAAER
jgi:SNF2 family DNA or RNA helicase